MSRRAVLWLLLALFVLRVAGQLAVWMGVAPFLPPMPAWYSGLLPYGPLLVSQLLIIALLAKVSADVTRRAGYFARPHAWLDRPVRIFGWLYASAMIVRYVVTMAVFPERRWFGGTIPIVFHLVLAAYLLVLAGGQRRARLRDAEQH
jgi:hypothetical protein